MYTIPLHAHVVDDWPTYMSPILVWFPAIFWFEKSHQEPWWWLGTTKVQTLIVFMDHIGNFNV